MGYVLHFWLSVHKTVIMNDFYMLRFFLVGEAKVTMRGCADNDKDAKVGCIQLSGDAICYCGADMCNYHLKPDSSKDILTKVSECYTCSGEGPCNNEIEWKSSSPLHRLCSDTSIVCVTKWTIDPFKTNGNFHLHFSNS